MFRSFAGSLIISMLLLVTSSTVNASPKPEISWEKEGGDWVATVILKTDLKENNNLEVKSFSGPMTFVGDADRAWIELIIDTDEGKKEHAEELLKKAMPKWDFNGKTFTLTGSDYKETGFFFKGERQPAWQLIAHLPKSFNVKADTKGGGI
ncbi:hypothetical protein K8I28_01185, partial [bacterium]|nr:hypothetical protein [bacterium]